MSRISPVEQKATIFERIWDQTEGHLYKSDWHGVMAVADTFPKMPLQVVVAPARGNPGEDVHFYDLELKHQRRLLEVGLVIGSKILEHCAPRQRSMFTLEGFAVRDHVHIVYYAGERGQGIDRYSGECLGEDAVRRTIEAITLSSAEAEQLDTRLDRIG